MLSNVSTWVISSLWPPIRAMAETPFAGPLSFPRKLVVLEYILCDIIIITYTLPELFIFGTLLLCVIIVMAIYSIFILRYWYPSFTH